MSASDPTAGVASSAGPAPPATGGVPAGGTPGAGGLGRRIAGAAALIAALTILARLAGFARVLVFSKAVGSTDLGSIYLAANTVPNVIFQIVAGGALAALVVPLLAGPLAAGDRRAAGATASALLTWVLLVLVPLAVVVAVAARPLVWLLDAHGSAAELAVGARMLRVFAPQLPLYGVGIVLTGVLQAHHRFAWPVLAPLLSSVAVIGAYVVFALVQPSGATIGRLDTAGELVLSVGTTLGVVVMSLCLVLPVRRLGLRWRPSLRFAAVPGRSVRSLAGVGVVTVAAQQLTTGLVIALANRGTAAGTLVVFNQAQTLYLLPWAVLAVPVATSAYPVLARAHATGDGERYRATLAGATRSVLLLCGLGAAGLAALAGPAAWLMARVTSNALDPVHLARGLICFAPGLFGYGLFALHSRALYAAGRNRSAAGAAVFGWAGVAAASVALAAAVPAGHRIPALAAANSVGMLLLAAGLLAVVRRWRGARALPGVGRAGAVAVLAGTLSAVAGTVVRAPLPEVRGVVPAVAQGVLSGAVALVVFVGLVAVTDRGDARRLLTRVLPRRSGIPAGGPAEGVVTGPAAGDPAAAGESGR